MRRIISVLFGLIATGFVVLLWVYRESIPDDWEAGFGWMYVIQGLLVVGFGAGAVTLWFPKGKQGLGRKVMFGAFSATVVIVGIILMLAID